MVVGAGGVAVGANGVNLAPGLDAAVGEPAAICAVAVLEGVPAATMPGATVVAALISSTDGVACGSEKINIC